MNDSVDTQWLEVFQKRHGRPLQVLHIGNIASNGYLNAKFQRSVGIHADVLNIDYRHVMAFPEWEDADLKHPHGDDFNPRFHSEDLATFQRPDWFISGNLYHCLEIIRTRYQSQTFLGRLTAPLRVFVRRLRSKLVRDAHKAAASFKASVKKGLGRVRSALRPLKPLLRPFWGTLLRPFWRALLGLGWVLFVRLKKGRRYSQDHWRVTRDMQALFKYYFPDRRDQMAANELLAHAVVQRTYRELVAPYDIVQAYATMGYIPLIAGTKPYTTFEHGTLRSFTMDSHPLHRLTALSYRHSQHTFITNGDCLAYAKALDLDSYSPMIHPINVAQHRQDFSQDVAQIRRDLGGDILVFCPARHDYEIKGTDKAIKAMRLLQDRTNKRVVMVLAAWGG